MKRKRILLGKVPFGDAIPAIEGGWCNELTGEWGIFVYE